MSLEPAQEHDEQPEGNYLFWALIGTAFVVILGSTAILNKMQERPNLAEADPFLMNVLRWARISAGAGLVLMAGLLSLQLLKSKKK